MITGTPKFDGLALGEIRVDFLSVPGRPCIEVKAAFVSSKTGKSHGWTRAGEATQWSQQVLEKLHALREQLELELAQAHLDDTNKEPEMTESPAPGGLGEHLSESPLKDGFEPPPA